MPINFQQPEAEAPTPTGLEAEATAPASIVETAVDPNPPVSNSSEPINFAEPPALKPLPENIDQPAAAPIRPTQGRAIPEQTWQEKKDAIDNAAEREKREFYDKIMAARQPLPEPPPPPPVAPRVAEQTAAEMAAGARQVARHAEARAINPPPPREDDTRTTRVFAPEDYVPDPRKGQGVIPTATYRVL